VDLKFLHKPKLHLETQIVFNFNDQVTYQLWWKNHPIRQKIQL